MQCKAPRRIRLVPRAAPGRRRGKQLRRVDPIKRVGLVAEFAIDRDGALLFENAVNLIATERAQHARHALARAGAPEGSGALGKHAQVELVKQAPHHLARLEREQLL